MSHVKIPNKAQLNKRNEKGESVLHKACKRGDLTHVKALIQAGISINMADYAGLSWLSLFAVHGFYILNLTSLPFLCLS